MVFIYGSSWEIVRGFKFMFSEVSYGVSVYGWFNFFYEK